MTASQLAEVGSFWDFVCKDNVLQRGMNSSMSETTPNPPRGAWFFSNAYLMLTLTPLFWAGNFIMGKWVAGDVPPFALGGLRWIVASVILLPFAWPHLRRDWPTVRKHIPIILFLGLTGPTLFNTIS